MSATEDQRLTQRPNDSDWGELIDDWAVWSGDFPVKVVELYDRVACRVDGFQFETASLHDGKLVRFGQELKKQRDRTIGDMTVRSGLRKTKLFYWLEPVGVDYSGDKSPLTDEAMDRLFETLGPNYDRDFFLGMSDIDLEDHRATRNMSKRG